jgi:hypothetical protein
MSWIDQQQQAAVRHLGDLFDLPPSGPEVTLGAEDECFFLRADGTIATPEDTQAFLRARLALGGEADWEPSGEGLAPRLARVREERAGAKADELFASCKVDRAGYLAARAALPEQGLNTPFGHTRLRELLPRLCAMALESCERLGVASEQLEPLRQLMACLESPAEQHRRSLATLRQAEAAALARGALQLPR